MKHYIHGLFKSFFTALDLEVREIIDCRFTKFEEMDLSYQTPGAILASTHAHVAAPAYTHAHGVSLAYTHAPASDSTCARAPTLASTHTSSPAPTTSHTRVIVPSSSRAPALSHTGGPTNAVNIRYKTKVNKKYISFDVLGYRFAVCNIDVRMLFCLLFVIVMQG